MALDTLQAAEVIINLEKFLDKRRPPENMRHKLDLNYKIENQSITIFETRPHWQRKTETIESSIAKATWAQTKKVYKIYWMRADLKWHSYKPQPMVKTIEDFLQTVNEDAYGCFWG